MRINTLPFKPIPIFSSGHFQTIMASFSSKPNPLETDYAIVELADGDKLRCEISAPPQWKPTDPTVVFVHGLGGSHRSSYLLRLTTKLLPMGYRVIRVNLRGVGSGEHLARRTYHAGISNDVFEMMKMVKRKFPLSPTSLIGFSLGGNICLKMLGELGAEAEKYVDHCLTICPAVDLHSCSRRISMPQFKFYERYYLHMISQQIHRRQKLFHDIPKIKIPKNISMYEFDECYTSVIWDFKNPNDYYKQCSSKEYLSEIKVPCHVIFSLDDPIIDPHSILKAPWPKQTELWQTEQGGHLGFLSYVGQGYGFRWMDYQIIKFLSEEAPVRPGQAEELDFENRSV